MARVLPLEVELSGEESISPGGVDEETTGPAAFSTVLVHRDHRRVRASRKVDGRHLHAFQDLGALGGAVAEQEIVELGAADFIGVGMILVEGEGEMELMMAADLEVRVEVRAGLLDPDRVDLLEHAEPLEDGQVVREQRLADVEAGMMLFLQHRDTPALLGE